MYEFWRQPSPAKNDPDEYVKATTRSAALTQLLENHNLAADKEILEVGCNVGRNLAYLHDHGYQNVTGVEINPHAVERLREVYPQLEARPVHVGAAEGVLPSFEDWQFGLTFTMAVLQHIHPDSRSVFEHIGRVSEQILAIEPTVAGATHREYPHDVPGTFRRLGWVVADETPMKTLVDESSDSGGLVNYTAWWFQRA
ncbi:class I SAM-dependent methyltransferase [Rhabdothermincola salaria]|uniref:class I SAM-dependent methyltransferase n=1 Tax=Rhabdothermincola salaria TaxID=2903142 RepID=UPI001E56692B|nr:class I SAM-dependent methyltransferase [Rhabdothermincola salaria]